MCVGGGRGRAGAGWILSLRGGGGGGGGGVEKFKKVKDWFVIRNLRYSTGCPGRRLTQLGQCYDCLASCQ